MQSAPIAVFAYNRPDHLRRTVEALAANELAAASDLHVYSDGPRNEAAVALVRAVRDWLPQIRGFNSVRVVQRSNNFGLAQSITSGVTELVNAHGRVIVLEDDMVTSPYFLRYMNEALELYAETPEVVSIHGYVYPVNGPLPETFFLRGADCWGWATWRRGWAIFDADGKGLLAELEQRGLVREFDFGGSVAYTRMLRNQIDGKNDSWAVRWYASAFLADKLTLYPGRSLVQNIGNDGSGRHCGVTNTLATRVTLNPIRLERLECSESASARELFAEFFRKRLSFSANEFGRKISGKYSMRQARKWIRMSICTLLRRLIRRRSGISANYEVLDNLAFGVPTNAGWQHPIVAKRQHDCFQEIIAAMKAGRPREDFRALAEAVEATGMQNPVVIELGCGSGWNSQVLETLLGRSFAYTGLDISAAMIKIAKASYPMASFVVGDAMNTPFADGACDILISGTILMHQADYKQAIRECRRLTRQWCVFHTVPVLQHRSTTFLTKLAYGQPTIEVIFNEKELIGEIEKVGLTLMARWNSLDYDLHQVVGENTTTRTYLCRVQS